jgi:hypothetical protein
MGQLLRGYVYNRLYNTRSNRQTAAARFQMTFFARDNLNGARLYAKRLVVFIKIINRAAPPPSRNLTIYLVLFRIRSDFKVFMNKLGLG